FIALVAADTLLSFNNLKQMEAIGGSTFKVLLTLAEGVVTEDAEFYASLQMHLPKMTEIEALFQSRAKIWADMVQNKDAPGFARRMNALRETLEKADPDFRKAYENMYKLLERG
ncbi:MAG: prephenate dehydrogenase, partial [Dehalococcoidales bacterium]|nr:prephenate dehydrogenase [Dehalococcoidales bacterium]